MWETLATIGSVILIIFGPAVLILWLRDKIRSRLTRESPEERNLRVEARRQRMLHPEVAAVEESCGGKLPERLIAIYADHKLIFERDFEVYPPGKDPKKDSWWISDIVPLAVEDQERTCDLSLFGRKGCCFAGDGMGNFYWVPVQAERKSDAPVYFACHDPWGNEKVAESLDEFLSWPRIVTTSAKRSLVESTIARRRSFKIDDVTMSQSNPKPATAAAETTAPAQSNFVREIIREDLKTNKYNGRVWTRFPPEPNGYLHIGHAKAIVLDFGLADEFGGGTNLRFDDTNPEKEETEYVDSIQADVRWLGFNWENLYYASDYFQQLYDWAVEMIKAGKAYVCDLSAEEVRRYRGTLTEPGKESPYRNRSVEENLDLFARMKAGDFADGARTLRAKIDMASPNLNMRDPVMYRIVHAGHHRTGDKWCIYPTYDYAHGQSDSIENITHSICTLEFEDHRPLYNWYIKTLGIFPSQQIEFDRLNLTYTLLSKRKLLQLVREGRVSGWDDPRMPTLSGIRRRGYTPEAIRSFCGNIGVTKTNGTIELAMLEHFVREDLNKRAPRVMAVLKPLKVVIDNYPEGQVEEMDAVNNPEDPGAGTRKVPFSRELHIEQDDFREDPPKGYFRLSPGKEVRLRYAYFITAQSVVKNQKGEIVEVHCTYDPTTRGGNAPDGRKVKSTIHWVSAGHAINAEVRLYENLFSKEDPNDLAEGQDFTANLNPNSLEVVAQAKLEPSLQNAKSGERYQFERLGYFCVDPDSAAGKPVFNRTVALKDTWAKKQSALSSQHSGKP